MIVGNRFKLKTRWPALLTWVLALTPFVLFFDILSLAVHVRLALGFWPKPNWRIGGGIYYLHSYAVLWFGLFTAYAALPIWLVCLCFRRFRFGWRIHLLQFSAFIFGCLAVAIYWKWDPNHFVTWYLDYLD
jgi:hypothetical protein